MRADGTDSLSSLGFAAYQAINPIDLPRIEPAEVISGGSGVYLEPPGTRRELPRYGAAFVDDPDQVGLFSGGIGPAKYFYPPAYTVAINDATLVGHRTILTPSQEFFGDEAYVEPEEFQYYLDRLSQSDSFSNEGTGLRATGRGREFQFDPGGRVHRHVEGSAVVLCSGEPLSYGSFLFRVVPKVKAVRALGLMGAPFIAYAEQKPFMDLLNFCGLPAANIRMHDLNAVTHIDRAIAPCQRNPHAYLDQESFDLYAELREKYGARPSGRKVYVSRLGLNKAGWSTRIMVNEKEVIGRLKAMNFDIIEPENLSVQDQILTFSSASIIVGPSGSGLFNTMFCHPGVKVIDIQSEPQWIYSYTGMYSSLKLEYGIFVGRPDPADTKPVHRRWTVNTDALVNRVRTFMAEA
jgi:hypothetical protein